MISIKHMEEKDIDLCYEFDLNTISLWSKKQWANEFKKEGVEVLGLSRSNSLIGICVFHVVLDEAQINFFAIERKYREKGFGTNLMCYLIKQCQILKLKKLYLEVSQNNIPAERFYNRFQFSTVGIRRNYYKDGSNAVLKEKKLRTK